MLVFIDERDRETKRRSAAAWEGQAYVFSPLAAREKRVARPSGAQRSLGVVEPACRYYSAKQRFAAKHEQAGGVRLRRIATHKLRLSVPPDLFAAPCRSLGMLRLRRIATHKLRLSVPPDLFAAPCRSLGMLRLRRISPRQAKHIREGRRAGREEMSPTQAKQALRRDTSELLLKARGS